MKATTTLTSATLPPRPRKAPAESLRLELWLRWGGALLIASVRLLSASTYGSLTGWQFWLLHFIFANCYWHSVANLFFWMQRRLPGPRNTARRAGQYLLLGYAMILLLGLPTSALENYFHLTGPTWLDSYLGRLKATCTLFTVAIFEYECFYFFLQWRRSNLRAAEFERENAQSHLETLNQQVDPSLLFDSLESLSKLTVGNQPVQEFSGALASIYQYVLHSKETPTVRLSEEMAFVDDYLYLNRIRFQGSIQVEQDLAPETLLLLVPPIAVQMLVENAIKHNAFGSQQPLRITIRAAGDSLTVSNSVRQKTVPVKSTRQGLQNIINRFALLTPRPLRIDNHGDRFEVVLPLLPATA